MIKKLRFSFRNGASFSVDVCAIDSGGNNTPTCGDIYTQDFAGLLNDEQKAEINQLAARLDDATGAQIAVLTVKSLDGADIQSFANQAFREYKLGDAEKIMASCLSSTWVLERCG